TSKSFIGLNLMVSEGGFGLGLFYNRELFKSFNLFADFSFSEAKDEREFEYIDWFGRTIVVGKKNRVFLMPLVAGFQYRLFEEEITENFRPYLTAGLGPSFVYTTPFEREFFSSFKYGHMNYALGGYVGIGAYFGSDVNTFQGLNIRYYYIRFFTKGVESLEGRFNKSLGGIYLTLNFGTRL
ncbi:MAG: hypothetical protein N3A61_01345, partial [Ignavibacteria bacterium]|nr:hypothetical protein [Ignavibacteria bacterium]